MKNRLMQIHDAAAMLFINRGYSRTQMKDIAREIGLSTGMLYVYFTGKRDILNFLFKCAIEPDFVERQFELPVTGAVFEGLERQVRDVLEENGNAFAEPLKTGAEGYGFERMLSDAFDTISRYGTGCLLIEKNPIEAGKLHDYYVRYRKQFFAHVLEYLTLYAGRGILRVPKYPEHVCQLIIETLSWWAMHVMNDAFEVHNDIPVAVAKEVCLDNLINAYSLK